MTLIQTLFTDELIIQVSDRRLTKGMPRSKSILIDDETYTKAVFWNQSFTSGFTGLARIDRWQRESTAHWIANVLSESPFFEHGVAALQHEAAMRIKKLPKIWDRRLAITIAGFDYREEPLVALITNFDPDTNATNDPTQFQAFKIMMRQGHRFGTSVAGAALDPLQARLLTRYVPKILNKPDGINRAVKMMVKIQRLVAEKNKTVGSDALCVIVPKISGSPSEKSMLLTNLGGPEMNANGNTFGFFDKAGWKFEQYAPIYAGGGMITESWFTANPDNPDMQTASMRFIKVPKSWNQGTNTPR